MSGLYGYLNDHLAGAAAAIRLAERCHAREPESELGRVLQALLSEIEEDRGVLQRAITALGGSANPVKRASAVGMERLGSLRMALPVLGPGSGDAARLEELEVLSLGIEEQADALEGPGDASELELGTRRVRFRWARTSSPIPAPSSGTLPAGVRGRCARWLNPHQRQTS